MGRGVCKGSSRHSLPRFFDTLRGFFRALRRQGPFEITEPKKLGRSLGFSTLVMDGRAPSRRDPLPNAARFLRGRRIGLLFQWGGSRAQTEKPVRGAGHPKLAGAANDCRERRAVSRRHPMAAVWFYQNSFLEFGAVRSTRGPQVPFAPAWFAGSANGRGPRGRGGKRARRFSDRVIPGGGPPIRLNAVGVCWNQGSKKKNHLTSPGLWLHATQTRGPRHWGNGR